MSQRTKPIEVTRSYLPIDPNSLPETMHGTEGEDRPEKLPPVIPYEGWNFMPSAYGYKSYFGVNSKLDINALATPARCRELFTFQKNDLSNMLIALCDDGIWTKQGESTGAWTHTVTLTDPNDGTVREWSYTIIENVLYIYRQGEASVYECKSPTYAFTAKVPTTLNMAGQLGIFKAGGRLGYWDSADAVGISAYDDKFYVTPSVGRGSNVTTIVPLIGKIINVLQHGDGFIIYATKSIIGVRRDPNNTFLWQAFAISNVAGISYRHQAVVGTPDTIHYTWTSIGLMEINNFQAQIIVPELYDYLKESKDPVYIKLLEGRHLAIQLANSNYVDGIITFYTHTVEPLTVSLSDAVDRYVTITEEQMQDADYVVDTTGGIQTYAAHLKALNDPGGCTPNEDGFCVGKDYGVYKEYYRLTRVVNGPVPGGTQGQLLSDIANFSQIQNVISNKAPNNTVWRSPTGDKSMTNTSPFPYAELTRYNNNDQLVDDAITPDNPAENNVQQAGEVVYIVDSEGNFFNRFNAIVETYNKFANVWYETHATRMKGYNNAKKKVANEALASTLIPICRPIGHNSGSNIDVDKIIFMSTNKIELQKMYAQDPAHGMIRIAVNTLLAETGFDGELLWGQAKANKLRISTLKYNSNKKIKNCTLTVIGKLGALAAFTYPPTTVELPENGTTSISIQTALNAIKTAAEAFGGIAYNFRVRAIPYQGENSEDARPYLDKDGVVVYDTAFDINNPLTVNAGVLAITQGPEVDVAVILASTTSLETEDTSVYTEVDADLLPNAGDYCDTPSIIQGLAYPNSYVQYQIDGSTIVSPTVSVYAHITSSPYATAADNVRNNTLANNSICDIDPNAVKEDLPAFNQMTYNDSKISTVPIDFTLGATPFTYQFSSQQENFTFPGATFLMQQGAPVPYDILFEGAYVYDTHLKRWGKMKQQFRQLLDFSPINSTALNIIPATQFGIQGAILNDSGEIRLFDMRPTDSYIKYGKIGIFRHGFSCLEEARADFRTQCTGQLEVETSVDGRSVDAGLTQTYDYTNTSQISQGIGNSGRWHNLAFRGQFDLSYLEFRAWPQSRR